MTDREQRIRERAYALWKTEGEPSGHHDRHWEDAAREVDAQGAASAEAEVAPVATEANQAAETTLDAPAASEMEPAPTADEGSPAKPKRTPRAKAGPGASATTTPPKRKPTKPA